MSGSTTFCTGCGGRGAPGPPARFELSAYRPAASEQCGLPSRCAESCAALAGSFVGRSIGQTGDGSAQFLYQKASRLAGATDDGGAGLRTMLMALLRVGLLPERSWSYDGTHFPQGAARLPGWFR
jgi:hypothetical protein